MLEFTFEQDDEFSNPYYNIHKDLFYQGYISFHEGKWSVKLYLGERFGSAKLREIADKVDELNASLRAQRWFK